MSNYITSYKGMSSSPGLLPGNAAIASRPLSTRRRRHSTSRARPLSAPAAAAGSGDSQAAPGVTAVTDTCLLLTTEHSLCGL